MIRIKREIVEPKRIVDWEGHYVVAKHPVENGLGRLPADSIFEITSAGVIKHLRSTPCKCCGFQLNVSVKKKREIFLSHFGFVEIESN